MYGEVGVLGDAHEDDGGVCRLQTQRARVDLLQRSAEEDAHGFQRDTGGGELQEPRQEGVGVDLGGLQVEGDGLEEEDRVVLLDVVSVDGVLGGEELQARATLVHGGQRVVEGEHVVDAEGRVVEVVELVVDLRQLASQLGALELRVDHQLVICIGGRIQSYCSRSVPTGLPSSR